MARGRRHRHTIRSRIGTSLNPRPGTTRDGPSHGAVSKPALWDAWGDYERDRMRRASALFAAGNGAEVVFVNPEWTDQSTAEQFALVTMDYALMGLYVAKEFCEMAFARVIRAQGRQAHLARSMTSPFDLRAELHPNRLHASQLKTGMQSVDAHVRARKEYDDAARAHALAFASGDAALADTWRAKRDIAGRKLRAAEAGERSERLLDAYTQLQAYHLVGSSPEIIARAEATVRELEAIETFALEKYTNIAAVREYAHGDLAELAPGVHRAYRAKLRDMLLCDDIIRVAGLPDPEDHRMMIYEVTGVKLAPGSAMATALRGVDRRGAEAFRAVRNRRADASGRITSWEAELRVRRRPVGTLRLSTRSGMLHLTNLSAQELREPIMRIRAPRPEQLRDI